MKLLLTSLITLITLNQETLTTFFDTSLFENQTHQGNPKNGCESDELAIRVQGINGDFCSPKCTTQSCPSDLPDDSDAAPECALKTTTGEKQCALICNPGETECPSGANCQKITGQTVGVCTFPVSELESVMNLING